MSAPIKHWVHGALDSEVRAALQRLAEASDVQHVAVMPDVHLANAVCIGTVTATSSRILPEAVGGDIGCGMAAVRFDAPASILESQRDAGAVLRALYHSVPFIKHATARAPALPDEWRDASLSCASLNKLANRDGRLQLGTLGRGNHFLELQRDEAGQLWLMVHSGSRAMGPAIREHHLQHAKHEDGLRWLCADDEHGLNYLADVAWARRYARRNRAHMLERVAGLMLELFGAHPVEETSLDCDHNHVQLEQHQGRALWVHRKGALHAAESVRGVIPGSMGSPSYHVIGRGEPDSLCSSSHGAGRCMSRSDARRRISHKQFALDVHGVWFDHRLRERLREEAPSAYKDIAGVMRAQRGLTCIVRKLQPVLVYKGG